jgi:hypothetical protein
VNTKSYQVAEVAFEAWQVWADRDEVEVGGEVVEDEEAADEIRDMRFVEAMGILGVILRNHARKEESRVVITFKDEV